MLQGRALPVVLRESLEQIAVGRPVRLQMTVDGQPRPLREEADEALLRIGQEAVANAVRHAQASEIQVVLIYGFHHEARGDAGDGCRWPQAGSASARLVQLSAPATG